MDRIIEKKKWTSKRIGIVAAGSALILFVLYSLILGDHSSKLNVQSERITISTVIKGAFQEFIPVTGSVIPIKTVYLDAIEGGRVDTVFLEAGTLVKRGDAILQLENTDLLLNILYRESDLAEQSNALRNTRLEMERNRLSIKSTLMDLDYQITKQERQYNRYQELYKKELISLKEFEDIQDEYKYLNKKKNLTIQSFYQDSLFRKLQINNLEASLRRMQENLRLVKQNLENLTVRSPIDGQLTSLIPEIGESISRGERIGQIDVLDGFKVRVEVDEHYIARINSGQQGEFDFNNNTFRLEIEKVYPEVKEGRFEVDMIFMEASPENIRRGQTLHVRLELGDQTQALLLARGGFYQKTGGQWAYVVNESGNYAEKRSIRIGRQNPQAFEVLEGLQEGEKVITSSYDNYGDIDKLILKN
ncbi:MAG: HlyD family efflux transporter periplasmic adaptor subunit [Calditrichaceae bacterium]|nr:HlyD family efflux transporter periplasmic adaptor subunit [Calditrichaceae bacterium]MBN2709824.1 HlyD family efflux transporter periplasmic adaptor subunit [Calditrichaceae bacterium]